MVNDNNNNDGGERDGSVYRSESGVHGLWLIPRMPVEGTKLLGGGG